MPSPRDMLMQMLQKGIDNGGEGATEAFKQRGEADKIHLQHSADLDSQDQAIQKVKALQGFFRGQDPHQKLNVGVSKEGATVSDVTPYNPVEARRTQGGNTAIAKANDYYMKGLPKIQDKAQAAQMGLDAANDPKQTGSLGQARTLILKTFGMNRYNQEEANAVLPPAVRGLVAKFWNSGGGDMNPLNESQRAALNSIFTGTLQHAKEQHDMLKQNALNTYKTSGYYDEGLGKQLEETMGGPFGQKIDESMKKYAKVPTTQAPEPDSAPLPGVMDHVMGGLHALFPPPKPRSAPAAPAPQAPAPQGAAPQGAAPQAPAAAVPPTPAPQAAAPQGMPQAPMAPHGQQPGLTPPPSGKVRVAKGTEVLEIDPADLPHAQNDGYQPVVK